MAVLGHQVALSIHSEYRRRISCRRVLASKAGVTLGRNVYRTQPLHSEALAPLRAERRGHAAPLGWDALTPPGSYKHRAPNGATFEVEPGRQLLTMSYPVTLRASTSAWCCGKLM